MKTHLLRVQRTLLTGFFIIAPVSLSFLLLAWFVTAVDDALAPLFGFFGRPIPGLGLVTALAIVLAAGVLGSNIAGQQLLAFFEELLLRIPVFNWLYKTIKQISDLFSPNKKTGFRSVVIVEYPRPGVYSVGFITKELVLESAQGKQALVSVYVPTNNMYIGDTILVPADKAIRLNLSQQQGIQAILSAGAALPDAIRPGSFEE